MYEHHPLRAAVTELNNRGMTPHVLCAALGCTHQRARKILALDAEPTITEFAIMLRYLDRVLPEWSVLPVVTVDLAAGYPAPLRSVKPRRVAGGMTVLLAISASRAALQKQMPVTNLTLTRAHTAADWMRAQAADLWAKAGVSGGDPAAALATFCERMSTAVLNGALTRLCAKDQSAVVPYLASTPTALRTRYDALATLAPGVVDAPLTAIELYERRMMAALGAKETA